MSPGLRRGTRADPDSAVLRRILASPIESTAIVGQASSRIAVAACATPCEIYRLGAGKLDDVLDWCGELAVPAVPPSGSTRRISRNKPAV